MTAKSISKICSIGGCNSLSLARGWCSIHYQRWRRLGDPSAKLTNQTGTGSTREERFWSRVKVTPNVDECWEWQGAVNPDGYGSTKINGKYITAHRLAWLFTYGSLPIDQILRHCCDNARCVNPNHLLTGTHADNSRDRGERQRTAKGETAGRTRLTAKQVQDIRRRCKNRGRHVRGADSQLQIAKEFGVGRSTIYAILNNLSWRH